MQIIDGNKIAKEIKEEIRLKTLELKEKYGKVPHLAAILVGNDGGSISYVNYKVKDCSEVGFESTTVKFEDTVSEEELLKKVSEMNLNPEINGIIVQLPLPKHIDEQKIINSISPEKDVDGFHPINVGKMALGIPAFVSATPLGITLLLERYGIKTEGKHCVIIGRSNIVGRPMSILMSQKKINATVTVLHSSSENLKEICRTADILIAAIGKPNFVTVDMVKENAVVIDVGTTRLPANNKSGFKLFGDVDFENVSPKCSFITPVPGGVGPLTRLALLLNTLQATNNIF